MNTQVILLQVFTGLQYLDLLLLGFGVDSRQSHNTEMVLRPAMPMCYVLH